MSIAELPNNSSRSFSTVGADFERTPPQDLIAEQSVLGAMMLSKDAIADVIEVIRERDFYRPAHELSLMQFLISMDAANQLMQLPSLPS